MKTDTSDSVASEPTTSSDAPHVLAVDDEVAIHGVLERLFPREGIQVTTCTSGDEALKRLAEDSFDLVLADLDMRNGGGMELLDQVTEAHAHVDVILLSTQENVQQAVRAMRKGAVDYIPKPFSTDELVERVKTILETSADGSETAAPATNGASKNGTSANGASVNGTSVNGTSVNGTSANGTSDGATNGHANGTAVNGTDVSPHGASKDCTVEFVGEHQSVQELRGMAERIAACQAPVFVQGESGTGKEILSRLIHDQSPRADQPYVPVNCAALPTELVESHLFGHVEGAFTGAVDDMTGAFEKADGGTLLLDEITEITCSVQAKLLRVLQTQEFQKVGASEKKSVDVRIIATTNRDLEEAVEEGTFREDLYHRLAVFPLHTPPLRGRLSDIPLLAEHFVDEYAEQYDLPEKTIAPDLLQRFQSYSWPGNVRELENVIHRGVVMAGDRDCIKEKDVIGRFFSGHSMNGHASSTSNGDVVAQVTAGDSPPTIEEMERKLILNTLAQDDVSQKEAAEDLGVSARTIRNKLQDYREQGFSV